MNITCKTAEGKNINASYKFSCTFHAFFKCMSYLTATPSFYYGYGAVRKFKQQLHTEVNNLMLATTVKVIINFLSGDSDRC